MSVPNLLCADAAPNDTTDMTTAVAALVEKSEQSNRALMRGDIDEYLALAQLSPDFTLMSPMGGDPSRGADYTPARMEAMGRFFRNGTLQQEVIETYSVQDMVVLALIERAHVEVGGLPAQNWALRVTLVYRRNGSDWSLVHRHADPLVHGISVARSAALARGD
jgi:ketosteroid isomerase-like protein